MSLTDHVGQLRTLAALDPDTTLLQQATINVMAELAEVVDRLEAEHPRPPEDEHGLGTI
jgi:hypothetical protein